MGLKHRRHVGQHDTDRIVLADVQVAQGRGQLTRTPIERPIVRSLIAVNDRCDVGKDIGGSCQKTERAKGCVIGSILIKSLRERANAGVHDHPPLIIMLLSKPKNTHCAMHHLDDGKIDFQTIKFVIPS